MANSLYDLLEVSQSASGEAITAAYKRLQAKHSALAADGDDDATNRMIAVREAWYTLSDERRRQRYDESLSLRENVSEPFLTRYRPYLLVALLAMAIGYAGIQQKRHLAEQETQRLQAEKAIAEAKAAEIETQQAQQEKFEAAQAEAQLRQQRAIERANREREIAYSNQISRNIERAETEARWAKQREEQQKAQLERQRQYEAENQLAREKAYLRQIEAEKRHAYYRIELGGRE